MYFIPILSMLLSVYLPGLVIQSISFDEQSKWKNYVRVLPVSVTDEALSKYIPLFLYCIISGGIIFTIGNFVSAIGFIPMSFAIITIDTLITACYGFIFGCVSIPATYRFGTANSRYFIMGFILIPVIVVIVLSSLKNIKITNIMSSIPANMVAIMIVGIFILAAFVSIKITIHVLKSHRI
ncbi:ABC-2 transporter permease [Caproicibacterium amylolyticum]|uniref:ABC-2 transporter permease n=1 Tax=Caproicibacterium amylolyticum TaxID=2766537 RepID=A0A7G9WIC2_9FIRM|nr:ABC-2 transporter permease [Caproicibacterium amylolyticum]